MDFLNFEELQLVKLDFIYEIEDVKKELEELSEDEDDLDQRPAYHKEIWEIKAKIKKNFK